MKKFRFEEVKWDECVEGVWKRHGDLMDCNFDAIRKIWRYPCRKIRSGR